MHPILNAVDYLLNKDLADTAVNACNADFEQMTRPQHLVTVELSDLELLRLQALLNQYGVDEARFLRAASRYFADALFSQDKGC